MVINHKIKNRTDFFFLGHKLDTKFLGKVVSDYRKHPESWRNKFKMKLNSIKIYDKFSYLRIEMIINDPKEFKVYKESITGMESHLNAGFQ